MDCFRPQGLDLSVKAVLKPYESSKALVVDTASGCVLLRGKKGTVLERIPMDQVRWLPCSLPGGLDHCISIQFKEPQHREVFLRASSRAAVADILTRLDSTAPKSRPVNTVHIEATSTNPATAEDLISIAEEKSSPNPSPTDASDQLEQPPSHSPTRCPRCWQLAQLIDEHEAQLHELEILKSEVASYNRDLECLVRERDHARDLAASSTRTLAQAQERQIELEKCLREATERCEKLVSELMSAADTADNNSAKVSELETELAKAEEEKKLLVDAMTTAQAQQYDTEKALREAQKSYNETVAQLKSTSQNCAALKVQAAGTISELDDTKQEILRRKIAVKRLEEQIETLQGEVQSAKREVLVNEKAWREERTRLENTISTLVSQTSQQSGVCKDEVSEKYTSENFLLKSQIEELKEQLKTATAQKNEQRTTAAEEAVLRMQKEVDVSKKMLEKHFETLRAEAHSLRSQLGQTTQELESERTASRRAAARLSEVEFKLEKAMEAHAEAIKDRHVLEAAVERAAVENDRLRRRNESLEARCKEWESARGNRSH